MITSTRIALLFILPLTLPLTACDIPGDGDTLEGGGGCVEEVTVLAGVDAANALGFTAAEVLDFASGEHASPMVWGEGVEDGLATVHFGPEAGAGKLTAVIDYAGGEVRYVKSSPAPSEYDGGFAICNDRLEIDVEVKLESAGGAFHEGFMAALRATTPRIATLVHDVAVEDLDGSLALTEVSPASVSVGDVHIELGITEDGLFGGASSVVEVHEDDWVAATFMNYATWPGGESPCYGEEAPIALESAAAGFSGADALALAASAGALEITWQGGVSTSLELALVHDGKPVCAVYQGEGIGNLRFGATATVLSGDGRWSGSFPVQVTGEVGEGGALAGVRFYREAPYAATVPAADFLASFGLGGVDLAGYDAATIDFNGAFTPVDGGASASGKLEVLGVIGHSCPPDANGCEGNTYESLETASWASK